MSKHCYDIVLDNENISITIGWDNPLQGFFMIIEKSSDEDDPYWSNLIHHKPPFPKSLDSFLRILKNLNIDIPKQMINELLDDQKNNIGNKHVAHYLDNDEYFRQE